MKPVRSTRGFTLIEVLAAAVILSVALAVIIGSVAHSMSASKRVETKTQASELACEILNRSAVGELGKLPAQGTVVCGPTTFEWQVATQKSESQPLPAGVELVTCKITWLQKNTPMQLTMQRRMIATTTAEVQP